MYRQKGPVIGVVLLSLLLIFGSIGLACAPKPDETPTSLPPLPAPQDLPANYTTYTDESNIFSISYPSDWENASSHIPAIEQTARETIGQVESGIPLEKASIVFVSGKLKDTGFDPNINIAVETAPVQVSSNAGLVEAEILGVKQIVADYQEFSRVNTTIDGRDATIIDFEGTFPGMTDKVHGLIMCTLAGRTGWIVTCGTVTEDFNAWKSDFDIIVRSLRIAD